MFQKYIAIICTAASILVPSIWIFKFTRKRYNQRKLKFSSSLSSNASETSIYLSLDSTRKNSIASESQEVSVLTANLTLAESEMSADENSIHSAQTESVSDVKESTLHITEKTVISGNSKTLLDDPSIILYARSTVDQIDEARQNSNLLNSSPSGLSDDSGVCDDNILPISFEHFCYEVSIPYHMGSKIIGKHGRNVKELQEKCSCKVVIRNSLESSKIQILSIKGTMMQINKCQSLIQRKFPGSDMESGTYFNLSSNFPLPVQMVPTPVSPNTTFLHLPQGTHFDVIVCSVVSAGHFFVQQPTHPSFYNVPRLQACMDACYADNTVPSLPPAVHTGSICAVPFDSHWLRAQTVDINDGVLTVRLLDNGGYQNVNLQDAKQIRSDFLTLPFQAMEAILHAVNPNEGETDFSKPATKLFTDLIKTKATIAFLRGYNLEGCPLVDLFVRNNNRLNSISQALVQAGLVNVNKAV